MVANDSNRVHSSGAASLSPWLRPETNVEDVTVDALATTVDGGAGLSTATAVRSNDSVRSRSRSPHPHSDPALFTSQSPARNHISNSGKEKGGADQHDGEHNIRDTSLDLHSLTPGSSHGSHTDLSSFDDLDPLEASKSGTTRPKPSLRIRLAEKWESSKGLLMVFLAMLFSAMMGAIARLMQTGPAPMHTFQIIFARMSITTVLSMAYMWWNKVPDAPLGPRGVRKLLVSRGLTGFFGLFGLYFSVKYLPLGEATVITFLAPMVANGACSVLLKEPFTRREQLAAVISFVGVIFIARPFSSGSSPSHSGPDSSIGNITLSNSTTTQANSTASTSSIPEASPIERLIAVLVALLGVCGAAGAYTSIRWIGKRVHPLISVTYFSVWCTIVSLVALSVALGVSFRFPNNVREWLLLISLGTCGMVMQFLLTAGLSRQKGSAATNMLYTQMLFVLIIDYTVFGYMLTWSSWLGCCLILASQVWGAMARGEALKDGGAAEDVRQRGGGRGGGGEEASEGRDGVAGERRQRLRGDQGSAGAHADEEAGLVAGMDHDDNDDDEDKDTKHRTRSHDDGRIEMSELRSARPK